MDPTADPCTDFYQYSCGGWIRNTPIPADRSRISTYGKLYVDNQRYLWSVLEGLSAERPDRSETRRLLGDYFVACMNLEAIDEAGLAPMQDELGLIVGMQSTGDLGKVLGQLIHNTDGSAFFIALGPGQDARQSDMMIGAVHAAGLGLCGRTLRVAAAARGHGPAFPAALPHQRRGGEHAGVPGCLRLPGGRAHGQAGGGNLPDLVGASGRVAVPGCHAAFCGLLTYI